MNNTIISASILSANFAELGEDISKALQAGADWIHFDVMDNHFVPNLTVGPLVCRALRDYGITAPIDVHLMVNPADRLITEFAQAGATWITVHPEANTNLSANLQLIKQLDCHAGLALNPATPIDSIVDVYQYLDLILAMTVQPGFAGQQLLADSYTKIQQLHELRNQLNPNMLLGVDGGINAHNIQLLAKLGVNLFVAGSSIFNAPNYSLAIEELRGAIVV